MFPEINRLNVGNEELQKAAYEAACMDFNHDIVCLIGGSYVVDPANAKDIDVVYVCNNLAKDQSYWKKQGFIWQTNENGAVAEVVYETDHAIQGHWRKGLINLIAVRPEYWAAYYAAIMEMHRNPSAYTTRDERITLHRKMRDTVRLLIDPEADLEDENNR